MVQKKIQLEKCLYYHSEWNLIASNFLPVAWFKWHGFFTSVIFYAFSKLYILTELSANDLKSTPVDGQQLDLSKYIYLWYRKFYICRDTAQFYEHKT